MAGHERRISRLALACALVAGGHLAAGNAGAWDLYNNDNSFLKLNLDATYGWFSSQKSYYSVNGVPKKGRSTWQEGFVKLGLTGQGGLAQNSAIYAGGAILSSGTWGDGDAGGYESGHERKTEWEDLYVGWKSGDLMPKLGKDGMDLSIGRQHLVIGEGFVINNDQFNYGDRYGKEFDRGGLYWLSARQSFAKTAIMRIGGDSGLRADVAWAQSDNMAQSNTSFALGNIEHISNAGTYGFMFLRGLGVRDNDPFAYMSERNGMNLYNIRASSKLGTDNFRLSGEYVWEDKKTPGSAGFVRAEYTFADASWKPTLTYRYSRFSKNYDPMFFGWSGKYGTWWQGEVAGNYAGPFNQNAEVHHLGITVQPLESLTVGALYFDFRSLEKRNGFANMSGRELDTYLEWKFADHYSISPVVGLYDPSVSAANGGTQTTNSKPNLYTQVTFSVSY